MPRLKKMLVIAGALLLILSLAGFLALKNKYYVKRFVKSNNMLFSVARQVAVMKHNLTRGSGQSEEDEKIQLFAERYKDKTEWSLKVDFGVSGRRYDRFWGDLGYESWKTILTGKNRRLFELIQKTNRKNKGSFRFIRAHNLFSDGKPPWGEGLDLYTLDDAGKPKYNWQLIDAVFDRILGAGLKPIVELGLMPDAMASNLNYRQKWAKANISPPQSYRAWQELVYQTVLHLKNRYGEKEVSEWFFEVWNEPDLKLFWIEDPDNVGWGDMEEYNKLYDFTVVGATKALPQIKIGGPATAGLGTGIFLGHTLLEKNYATGKVGAKVDFLSSHNYGYIHPLGGKKTTIVKGIRQKVGRATEHDHKKVQKKMQQLPFLLTETGPSTKNEVYYNSRFMAAWWAKLVDAVFYLEENDGPAYAPESLVSWSTEQLLNQGFRNTQWGVAVYFKTPGDIQIVKRPLFNIFEMFGYLSDQYIPVQSGSEFGAPVHAVATKNGDESVECLVYHLNERDKDNAAPDSHSVRIELQNLPFQKYTVSHYIIDEMNSNGYTAWQQMGSPKKLNRNQAQKIDGKDDLRMIDSPRLYQSRESRFITKLKMQSNSVSLLVLRNKK